MAENVSKPASAAPRFHCVVALAPDLARAEYALAEAMAAGASGAEQRESERGVTLLIYAADDDTEAVRQAALAVVGEDAVEVRRVAREDWSNTWKAGLRAIEVSARLRVRPSFDRSPARPGQRDLVIDPGQAFGTGAHESTRLALEWLDVLRDEAGGSSGVLDVGTGSGILALAATAVGAERAIGLDLDALAAPAARVNAAENGLDARVHLFTGSLLALAPGLRFRGVIANLLRRELEPIAPELAARVEAGGWLVVSGLLELEVSGWCARCAALGIDLAGTRRARDASGVSWAALLMRPRGSARA